MGEAAASHHPVLPDCDCCVRGSVPGVRLQTSLERCARWPPAGRFGGYSHSKSELNFHEDNVVKTPPNYVFHWLFLPKSYNLS